MAHPGLNKDCDLTLERAISELGTLNIAASSSQFGSSARNQSSYPISDLRSLPISSANTINNVNNANTHFHLEKRLVQFNTLTRFQPSSPKAALTSPERDTPLSDVEADFEGAESESEEENMHRTQTLGYQEEISRLKQEIKTLKEKQEQLMLEEKIRLHKIRELYQKNESESNRANHLEEKLKKVDGVSVPI
ncbi:hypothetical protein CPB86DRAFT_170364 [Serendipita vermifera]|nr:hypothetical protein CPB86DRAFT_170364 [Serendipita vermifera]